MSGSCGHFSPKTAPRILMKLYMQLGYVQGKVLVPLAPLVIALFVRKAAGGSLSLASYRKENTRSNNSQFISPRKKISLSFACHYLLWSADDTYSNGAKWSNQQHSYELYCNGNLRNTKTTIFHMITKRMQHTKLKWL